MTTAQHMLASARSPSPLPLPARSAALFLLSLLAFALSSGCANWLHRDATPSASLPAHPAPQGAVWAVAPLRNESGAGIVDDLAVTDTLIAELSQAPGLVVLSVNRTLAAMRALNLPSIDTPAQAHQLAHALGADALIVGSITAWYPYDPPTLGLSLALFQANPPSNPAADTALDSDPIALRALATDLPPTLPSGASSPAPDKPTATFAAVFDASNGITRKALRDYADGRHDPRSALGWKRYTASMALYAKFACFEASRRLLLSERSRLGAPETHAQASAPH